MADKPYSDEDLKQMNQVFSGFCDATKKDSKTATDKTLKKICTDCGLYSKKMTANDVDIALRKHLGNKTKEISFTSFVQFVETCFSDEFARANGVQKEEAITTIVNKIKDGAPKGHGTTAASKDGATSRLTDVKGYTGAHAERFDAKTGKGKGIEGRADRDANTGYVGNYKGQGTYEKKK